MQKYNREYLESERIRKEQENKEMVKLIQQATNSNNKVIIPDENLQELENLKLEVLKIQKENAEIKKENAELKKSENKVNTLYDEYTQNIKTIEDAIDVFINECLEQHPDGKIFTNDMNRIVSDFVWRFKYLLPATKVYSYLKKRGFTKQPSNGKHLYRGWAFKHPDTIVTEGSSVALPTKISHAPFL